ncbi:FitA-like ribbon-helix-helix domain-containing protein [Enterococcus sp. LJL120]
MRNLPKQTVAALDEKAKHANTSREEYVRQLLVTHGESANLQNMSRTYDSLVRECLLVIQANTTMMSDLIKTIGLED